MHVCIMILFLDLPHNPIFKVDPTGDNSTLFNVCVNCWKQPFSLLGEGGGRAWYIFQKKKKILSMDMQEKK